jgi:hypothetical protein
VDPVPDPLLLRKSDSAGNRTQTSGSVTTRPQRRSIYFVLHYIMLLCTDVNYVSLIQEMSALGSVMAWLFDIRADSILLDMLHVFERSVLKVAIYIFSKKHLLGRNVL